MATEVFTTLHNSSRTVYFRFLDLRNPLSPQLWDATNTVWNDPANVAAGAEKISATEIASAGDGDESSYVASVDLSDLYNSAEPIELLVQVVDDLVTDELISTISVWVAGGELVSDARSDRLDVAVSSRSSFDSTSDAVTLADGAHGGVSATISLSDYSDFTVDPSAVSSDLLNTAITASNSTVETVLKALFSMARGKIEKSGDSYTFYDDDGSTVLFTLDIAASERTTS